MKDDLGNLLEAYVQARIARYRYANISVPADYDATVYDDRVDTARKNLFEALRRLSDPALPPSVMQHVMKAKDDLQLALAIAKALSNGDRQA